MELLVDPAVSKQKFDFELKNLRILEEDNLKRGWWVLKAEYPELFVVFATPQMYPPCVVFGVVLDFTNYDFWPPSVQFVNPFTRQPLKINEMLSPLWYWPKSHESDDALKVGQPLSLVQAHKGGNPFLCLPGVREYHNHPAHTGDSWLSHRGKIEGTLYFLLDKIFLYGIKPINGYQIGFNVSGLSFNPAEIQ